MKPIFLYSCMSCQKVIDNYLLETGLYSRCECGGNKLHPVNPTSKVLKRYKQDFRWHYYKLCLQELWEKVYGA